jgi:hypothetical protein
MAGYVFKWHIYEKERAREVSSRHLVEPSSQA